MDVELHAKIQFNLSRPNSTISKDISSSLFLKN